MKELWKDIKDFEGLYQVSNLGRVRSLPRTVRQMNKGGICETTYQGKLLKTSKTNNGYLRVSLSKGNKVSRMTIHRLVAQTFIPNPYNLPQVNHLDANRENNRVDNLEWANNSMNQRHSFENGRKILRGSEVGGSKLTEELVMEIRKKFADGGTNYHQLSKEYNVSRDHIRQIILRLRWKHI